MTLEKAGGRYNVRILEAKNSNDKMLSSGRFLQRSLKIARTFQMVAGVLCVVLCIVGIALKAYYSSLVWSLFTGLLIFILTGIAAALHGYRHLMNPIERVYMVMSIISAVYSTIMMIFVGVITHAEKMTVLTYSCYALHSSYCDSELIGRTIVDILLAFVFWVEIGCGVTGATVGFCVSGRSENVQKQCPKQTGNTPLDEHCEITGSAQECDPVRISNEYTTVVIRNEDENDITNDIVIEGTSGESTLQATASVDKHDKKEVVAKRTTREGAETEYMLMTGYCGNSDYEVMKNVTYVNERFEISADTESPNNQNDQNNALRDERFAPESEGTRDESSLQATASVDKHDKKEGKPEKMQEQTTDCEGSDYEVMKIVPYENARLEMSADSERPNNQNDQENDLRDEQFAQENEGTRDISTLQATASVDKHDSTKEEAKRKTREGGEADYMLMTRYCDNSVYEVMKNLTYVNEKFEISADTERPNNQYDQDTALRDERFAQENEGTRDESTLQATASVDKHDKKEGKPEKMQEQTTYCDSSDYEVMKIVPYENARLEMSADSERPNNQNDQDNALRDEQFAQESEGTRDESTLQATASVDKHDKTKEEAKRKTREGEEADYMLMTRYCDDVLRDERFAQENEETRDGSTLQGVQATASDEKPDNKEGKPERVQKQTTYCDSSDYEVMKIVTDENPRL